MPSEQILALMRLAEALNKPHALYRRAVSEAARTITDSPENLATIELGNTALLEFERVFRVWDAKYTAVSALPDGCKRTACITVACAVCGYAYDETEFEHHFPSVGDALNAVVGAGWDHLKDGRVLCETFDQKHEELRSLVGVVDPDEAQQAEVVHGCPPDGSGLTPCCGRAPFELPLTDRISSEAPITCPRTDEGPRP